ncbi:MAG: efflux RND transporter periplasmic adaptor subunit [Chromatiales bacterium]|nr:efflux RND transporter periplasmic adaptor subunit [Chromatiales bacterium]
MIFRYPFLLLLLLALLGGCGSSQEEKSPGRNKPALIVESTTAALMETHRTIERNATLHPLRSVNLSLQQEGVLLSLPFHEGAQVEKGAVLAKLDDTLLRAQLKKAEAQRSQAELELKRLKQLKGSSVVAENELARTTTSFNIARAEEEELTIRLKQSTLLAPFSGVIGDRLAEPGDTLPRLYHLLTLIDTSNLITTLRISELEMSGLSKGDEVGLTIDALGTPRFKGTIQRIHPMVDERSRQGTVEILLQSTPRGAMPGQLCRVELTLRSGERMLVPYNALRRDSRGEFVFVINSENRLERRSVISGLYFGERVEIMEGLSVGEQFVTRGFLGLGEGMSVTLRGGDLSRP